MPGRGVTFLTALAPWAAGGGWRAGPAGCIAPRGVA